MSVIVTNAEHLITLSVIRSLGRNGIDVTGASDDQKALSLYSKYCDKKIRYPSPSKKNTVIYPILIDKI